MTFNSSASCFYVPGRVDGSQSSYVSNIFTGVASSILSLITVGGNAFVIFVICGRPKVRQVPYNVLLGCLALSDFVVGIVAQPSMAISKIVEIRQGSAPAYCYTRLVQSCSGWLTAGLSLLILCAISLDRYLALKLHLRYPTVVTVPRVVSAVVVFWICCAAGVALRFFVHDRYWMLLAFVLLLITLSLIVVFYANVFRIIRRHRRQIRARDQLAEYFHGRSAVEVARHKRSAVTMMYVLAAFIVCYVPFLAAIIAETTWGYTVEVKVAYDYSTTFVFLSSSVNPILYCWRIREMRQAASRTVGRAKAYVASMIL